MIETVRKEVHDRCLNFRALDRLVQSEQFEQAIKIDPHNVFIHFAIISGSITEIEDWMVQTLRKSDNLIGQLSLKDLRLLASDLGVPYTGVSKDVLAIKVINAVEAQKKARGVSHP